MATLSTDEKSEIVRALAQFMTPAEVVAHMKAEFECDTDVRQVCGYDPTRSNFSAAESWREIFASTRKVYLEDVAAVPISNQSYRLNQLQQNYQKAVKARNLVLANATLEQAAKEVGGILTNERNLNVENRKGGSFMDLTPEERRQAAAELIHEALGRDPDQTAPTTETTQ